LSIKCPRCNGTGKIEPTEVFGGKSYICKMCGFQALGQTQVHDFEKRGGYCRECSGDYDYG